MATTSKLALTPPAGELVLVSSELATTALEHSRQSARKRVILPFHKHEADSLHRMFNAVQPGSYIRPHRHLDPPKSEAFIVLRGSLAFFTFDDDGRVRACARLAAGSDVFGADVSAGVFHSFIALEPDTLIYEVKPGPYARATDKAFGSWAPTEGAPEAAAYMRGLLEIFARRQAGGSEPAR